MRDRGKTRAAKAAAAAATAKPSAAEEPEPPRDEPSPPPPEPKEEVPIVVVTKSEEHTVSAAPPVVVVSPEFSAASLLLQQTLVRLQAKVAENKANEITSSDIQTMQRCVIILYLVVDNNTERLFKNYKLYCVFSTACLSMYGLKLFLTLLFPLFQHMQAIR